MKCEHNPHGSKVAVGSKCPLCEELVESNITISVQLNTNLTVAFFDFTQPSDKPQFSDEEIVTTLKNIIAKANEELYGGRK